MTWTAVNRHTGSCKCVHEVAESVRYEDIHLGSFRASYDDGSNATTYEQSFGPTYGLPLYTPEALGPHVPPP
jgi:hypothetical protein